MADARLRHRKQSRWPWLVGLILLLGALWVVAWILDPEGTIQDPAGITNMPGDAPEPVTVPAPANE